LILTGACPLPGGPSWPALPYGTAGRVNGSDSGNDILEYGGQEIKAGIGNGRLKFTAALRKPSLCRIQVGEPGEFREFYLENPAISFTVEGRSNLGK